MQGKEKDQNKHNEEMTKLNKDFTLKLKELDLKLKNQDNSKAKKVEHQREKDKLDDEAKKMTRPN